MRSEFQQQVFQGDISHQVQLYRSTVGVHQTSNIQHGESSNTYRWVCNGNGRLAAVKGTLVL